MEEGKEKQASQDRWAEHSRQGNGVGKTQWLVAARKGEGSILYRAAAPRV